MKIDITSSQYDRMIDIMTDVLFDNLNNDEIGVLRMDMERLDNLGASKFSDIGDRAYYIYRDMALPTNSKKMGSKKATHRI